MTWRSSKKSITGISAIAIRQRVSLRENVPPELTFGRAELTLSVGRTQMLASAVLALSKSKRAKLMRIQGSYPTETIAQFVDEKSRKFAVDLELEMSLPDEARTSLASKIGTGIADLLMEALGFHWRANAREMNLSPNKRTRFPNKIPDFVYDRGKRTGSEAQSIVVVEAKGSLSKTGARPNRIRALAQRAYSEQVRAFVGQEANGVVVANGYAIAFGAIPGSGSSNLAVATPQKSKVRSPRLVPARSLSAAASGAMVPAPMPAPVQRQSRVQHGGDGGGSDGGERGGEGTPARPNGRLAFANYESAFQLCGATTVANLIRSILSGGTAEDLTAEELVQDFWILDYNGRRFLVGHDPLWQWQWQWQWPWQWPWPGLFAVYEPSARAILQVVSDNLGAPPDSATLSIVPDEVRLSSFEDAHFVVQGDGLAFVDPDIRPRLIRWHARSGMWSG